MSELTHPVNIGKYQCILAIGQGGMGEVFLAVSHGPGGFSKLNVIKRLRHDIATDEGFVEMFLNEARLAGRLSHPNIVQTKEIGVDGNEHFMVMEYLEGQTLFYVLRRLRLGESASGPRLSPLTSGVGVRASWPPPSRDREDRDSGRGGVSGISRDGSGPKSISEVRKGTRSYHMPHAASAGFTLVMHLQVISDVLAGLHYAHEARDFGGRPLNLIHRDVAPSNIFITYDGHVKILDFGIAKAADSSNSTRAGVFKGKVAYMAPEQFVNANIDRRCDIFATGATLWEAAAGTRLWRGLSDVEIFRHLADGHIPPPSTITPNVNPKLEAICMRALSFDREQRYATAQELREDLDALIDELGRPSREEIGQVVAKMFANERGQTKAMIEAKLRALREQGTTPSPPAAAEGYLAVAEPTLLAPATPITFAPRRTMRTVGIAAGAVLAVGVGTLVWWKAKTGVVPPTPPMSETRLSSGAGGATSAQTTATDDPASKAASASVSGPIPLRISATPPAAMIFVDDVRLAKNPYAATVVPDASSHRVRVEAPGYRAQTDFVQFSGTEPISLHIDLVPLVPEKTKSAASPKRPPKPSEAALPAPAESPSAAVPSTSSPPSTNGTSKPPKPPRPKPFEIDVNDPYKK